MVCVNYKDIDYLKDECEDGRRLGYNGKVSRTKNTIAGPLKGSLIVLFLTASNSSQPGRYYTEYFCAHRERYIAFVTSFASTLMLLVRGHRDSTSSKDSSHDGVVA